MDQFHDAPDRAAAGAPAVWARPVPQRQRRYLIIAGVVVALLIALVASFQFYFKPALIRSAVSSQVPPPAAVTAEPARAEMWAEELQSIGTLVAVQEVDIAAQAPGLVAGIGFDSGATVAAGDMLVRLDDAVEQAELASNRAALLQAEQDLNRQQQLAARNVVAQATLEAARAKRDSADAAVRRSQAIIDQKTIKAPFAGRLGIRKVEIGQYVSAGAALVTLQSFDPIRVDFSVPEPEIGKLKAGLPLAVAVDAMPGETFSGTVDVLDARLDPQTRALAVRGLLPNPGLRLLPGMFASVTVTLGQPAAVVTVPRTAVNYSLYGDTVYVAREARPGDSALVAESRAVRLGETRGDRVAIAQGLNAGERVITSGQIKIQPGAAIRIDNSAPLLPQANRPAD